MTRLEILNLSFCTGIEKLPESLGNLTSLRTLLLKGCDALEVLPAWLGHLPALDRVQIDHRIGLENSDRIDQLRENGAIVQYSDDEDA